MTKPAKARKRPAAVRAAPVVLTIDEAELLRCYRTMDQRAKGEVTRSAQRKAENYPDRPRPTLRLITTNRKEVLS